MSRAEYDREEYDEARQCGEFAEHGCPWDYDCPDD
jgi:hypothetical protein